MRLMPFRTAGSETLRHAPLEIGLDGTRPSDPEMLTDWDYASQVTLTAPVTVDVDFYNQTGLKLDDQPMAALQVDCQATGWRALATAQIGPDHSASPSLTIPAGLTAQRLELQRSIVLGRARERRHDGTAWRPGSRLTPAAMSTIQLEGEGGLFPTEAFNFADAGLPPGALWELRFDPEDLNEVLLGSVRLLINDKHPRAKTVLGGRDEIVASVMTHDLFLELVLRVAQHFGSNPNAVSRGFDDESVGSVLDHLCQTRLGMSLRHTVAELMTSRAHLLSRIQERFGYLQPGGIDG